MKKSYWKPLFLLATFGFCSISLAQSAELKIKQDSKLDSILFQKIALDRERYGNEYYTLQLYYGNLEVAEQLMEKLLRFFLIFRWILVLKHRTTKFKLENLRIK